MYNLKTFSFLLSFIFITIGCKKPTIGQNETISIPASNDSTEEEQENLVDRYDTPDNYERVKASRSAFGYYLRNLALKPKGSLVEYYNGTKKSANGVYTSVIDMNIGNKDLHQCADAIMRLKAEFHWHRKEYDKIHFNLTNGFQVAYSEWMKGKRIIVDGNKTTWDNGNQASNSYSDFWDYMELIFMYAGTASLSKELKSVNIRDMEIGDIFIQGGHPGHAIIVIDMAENKTTGNKVFMLAQSYMPAQETQILINPNNSNLSPWYNLENITTLVTPEWGFSKNDLKRFQ